MKGGIMGVGPDQIGAAWPVGSGIMATLIREHDWSRTGLGPTATWPRCLRTAVGIMLGTRHPMLVFWGPDHIGLYNDAFAASLGPEKHPAILGLPGAVAWPEVWSIVEPQVTQVMAGGEASWNENHLVPILRHGRQDEVYWTYSYSPLQDDDDPTGIGGVLLIISETTKRVLADREQNRRLSATQANVGVGIHEMDADGRYLFVNETFTRLTGYRLEDFEGRTFFDLIEDAQDRAAARDRYTRLVQGEEDSYVEEHLYTSRLGRRWWAELRVTAVRDQDGRFVYAIGVVQDITNRKQAEMALRENEQRFRRLVEGWAQAVWEADASGAVTSISPGWAAATGQQEQDWLGYGWLGAVHPDDRDLARQQWEAAIREQRPGDAEFRLCHSDGTCRWVNVRVAPIHGADGRVRKWAGMNIDIHARRQAEATLRDREQKLCMALDAARMGIFDWAADADRIALTPQSATLFGLPSDKLVLTGAEAARIVHPDDLEQHRAVFADASRCRANYRSEYRIIRQDDGRVVWIEERGSTLADPTTGEVRVTGVHWDTTQRKEAENTVQAARLAAEEATRAKSRFLAAASHDLRQPVMAAGLYLGILEGKVRDPELRNLVDMVSLSLEGLRGMLNGLLETARFEAGIVKPSLETFALDGLLRRIATEFEGPARAARLWLEVPSTGLVVRSDKLLLELILRNLISNAVKYTERGGVTVVCVREGGNVRISVTDTGPGIAPEHQQRVFEDFVQVNEANRSLGFGLGLSTARRAAAVMGHSLDLQSAPGRGSTFSVCIPGGEEEVGANATAGQDESALPTRAVLVVEDDRMVAAALCMALEEWGLKSTVAHCIRDARAEAAKRRFDLVVSDYQLPDGDGFEAIAAAQDGGVGAAVLLTGDTRTQTLRRAHEAGLRLLTKPVDVRALRQAVRDAMEAVPLASSEASSRNLPREA